jgi:hypothetical protein
MVKVRRYSPEKSALELQGSLNHFSVSRTQHNISALDRSFGEVLTLAQSTKHARFFKFLFEFLEGTIDVFAFFYGYDQHI